MRLPRSATTWYLIAVLAVLLGCRAPRPEAGDPGVVRASLPSEPHSLSLIGKNDRYSSILAAQITDGLVALDAGLSYVPRLAESWEVSDDRRVVRFRLRRGVRWHDGEPFTARDVVFTVARILDPATEARSLIGQFEGVRVYAEDDYTVVAEYDQPYADFLDSWTAPIIPEHVAGRDADLLTGAFASHPIGCGPFRFVAHRPGRDIVLESNPEYWDGSPSIERLVFQVIPDERTAFQSLMNGDLDILAVTPDLRREAEPAVEGGTVEEFVYTRLGVWYVGWNLAAGPPFDDPRVRRAMALALDRDTFITEVLDGLAVPGATSFHPESPWTDPNVRPWPFDPERAVDLLRDAGWADLDRDGVVERGGTQLRFTVLMPRGSQELVDRIAAWMQESLRIVGVRMEIELLEFRAFLERRNAGAFDAVMGHFGLGVTPDQFELYHSSARDDGINFFGLADPEVDSLLEEGRREFDPRRRREIYFELQERLHELEPLMAMFHFRTPVLHRAGLRGVEPSAAGLWNIDPGPRAWHFDRDGGDPP